jgi:hypothetical protein
MFASRPTQPQCSARIRPGSPRSGIRWPVPSSGGKFPAPLAGGRIPSPVAGARQVRRREGVAA